MGILFCARVGENIIKPTALTKIIVKRYFLYFILVVIITLFKVVLQIKTNPVAA